MPNRKYKNYVGYFQIFCLWKTFGMFNQPDIAGAVLQTTNRVVINGLTESLSSALLKNLDRVGPVDNRPVMSKNIQIFE